MNCSRHHDRPAVGQCSECGAGLCEECYYYTQGHVCYDCVSQFYHEQKHLVTKYGNALKFWTILWMIVATIVGVAMFYETYGYMGFNSTLIQFIFPFTAVGLVGGYCFGGAVFANKGVKMGLVQRLSMYVFSFVLCPIFFFIRLFDFLKAKKQLKSLEDSYNNFPN